MIRYILPFVLLSIIVVDVSGCVVEPPSRLKEVFSESPYRDLGTLKPGTILHLPTGIEVTKEQMFHILSSSRIVYVGETHTNLEDHQVELEVLQGLWKQFPGQWVVGMEMFQKPSQDQLNRWSHGQMDEKEFIKVWYDNWDQSYNYYRAILRYSRDKKIPLIALNAPDELVHEIMKKGTEGLSENLEKELPEMDREDPYHRNSLKAVFGGHAHGDEGFERFYETMLIWDETMAQTISTYLSSPEGRGKKMVVFTGGFHVNYGFGVPRRVFRRLPEPYEIVMPYTEEVPESRKDLLMDVQPVSIPLYLADFVWADGYKDLEDQSVHLGVQVDKTEKGVTVRKVMPDSTALKTGIREGDIIVSFDGQSILEPSDLIHLMSFKQPGDHAILKILRGAQALNFEAQFGSEKKIQSH
jgi:uncharacterized iron-regulated protein